MTRNFAESIERFKEIAIKPHIEAVSPLDTEIEHTVNQLNGEIHFTASQRNPVYGTITHLDCGRYSFYDIEDFCRIYDKIVIN